MISPGDKVKYIGTSIPRYTGKVLEVQCIVKNGVILLYPTSDKEIVAVEGGGVWQSESLMCGFDDIEIVQ